MKEIDKEGVEWLVEMDVLQPNVLTRTMTPKEKAKELVDKYIELTLYHDKKYGISVDLENSKQCALIAADEVINSMTVATSVHLPYWQQVKHEIENL